MSLSKVLIANRGEIACRVSRTARSMGISTVAVFCDAEAHGKHVTEADEAYRLGPPPATTSYLRGDKIIQIAKECGAEAIHPGYGFLSENAQFADEVAKAGLEFIGPPSSAIRSMGSKSESKIIMSKANVPVLEGYNGEAQDDATLQKEANAIGYPVLIKAVMGGGGKGMKLVHNEGEFLDQLHSAQREAINFFKDDRVIIERYITNPRHIEVQVMCDKHGNGFYFFERDCSVQRRHQKVLEECPAQISGEIRSNMGEVAVRAAKAVGYVGAGTVEFIYDADTNKYYFMEMNTRLQVEHPVTEEAVRVRGEPLDLVKLQLLVAMGHPLPFTQEDIKIVGHAIEARIYAESPKDGFLPGSGHLEHVTEPVQYSSDDCKVRVDTGFRSGDNVLIHYDPMIAKLITWGKDRNTALDVMTKALKQYHVVGISTNVDFLQRSVNHSQFRAGGVTTKFIEENQAELLAPNTIPTTTFALAAVALTAETARTGDLFPSFRLNLPIDGTLELIDSDKVKHVLRVTTKGNTVVVQGEGFQHSVEVATRKSDGSFLVFIDANRRLTFRSVHIDSSLSLLTPDGTVQFTVPQASFESNDVGSGSGTIRSPINGKVVKLCVAEGSEVVVGQTVLILEAMKMEHNVKATCAGTVSYSCKERTMVSADKVIATITPPATAE